MTDDTPDTGRRRRAAAAVLVVLIAIGLLAAGTSPADAAARVTVRNDRGTTAADATYRTTLTITGRGFQVVPGGFGGVYLMFGWVDDPAGGSWRPSRGGLTGTDYRYVPDSESTDNQGYLKFIAFPGSSTAAEAQAVLTASGGFSLSLTVPGPVFRSVDREGRAHDVDCRRVRCGVITVGAHGVANRANETFTPVPFRDVYGGRPAAGTQTGTTTSAPAATAAPAGTRGAAAPTTAASPAPAASGPVATGPAAVAVDRRTARAGKVLAFTGTGFRPGESVVGVLDDGASAIGPLVAGAAGDVAGVLRLPRDLDPGTHELRLNGAVSKTGAVDRFPVTAGTATATPAAARVTESSSGPPASRLFLIAATVVFAAAVALGVRRLARRRGAAA